MNSDDKFIRFLDSLDRAFGRSRGGHGTRRVPQQPRPRHFGPLHDPTASYAPGQIAAIETIYHDHKFRSRLEARWAVFFDTLVVTWQYEVQGYDLEGTRYLPDFWLPDFNTWVEVKNPATLMHDNNWSRSRLLNEITGADVWVVGDLTPDGERLHVCEGMYAPVGGEWGPGYFFVECFVCGQLVIDCPRVHGHCTENPGVHGARIQAAYEAARFARFQ